MTLSRRAFLQSSAGAFASLALPGCRTPAPAAAGSDAFRHGVASGDPLADRVVLWTRVSPADARDEVRVDWRLARDPELRDVVARGSLATGPARDWTAKVDAEGLEPGGVYHYGFEALGRASPVGRTRTLPVGRVDRLRFGVVSCANHPAGFFNAYAHLAERPDLDAVLHLGDYIYEYGEGGADLGRVPEPPHELLSLADYRTRYAQYRGDPDLQAVHRRHPFITAWDDHESANDAWRDGAGNHDASEGDWEVRRAAAVRAWFEWMPVRALPGEGPSSRRPRTWRSFRFGDLADLVMLDARLYGRDAPVTWSNWGDVDDPERSMLGRAQEAWLFDQLTASRSDGIPWRLVGQQVPFGQLSPPGTLPLVDKWDGYRAARARVLDHLERRGIDDVVILSGDIHSSWALDVSRDPFSPEVYDPATGRGSLAVELTTPAVSSPPLAVFRGLRERLADAERTHPHCRFLDLEQRGYLLLDLDRERARGEWWFVDGVGHRPAAEHLAAAVQTRRGSNHWKRVDARD